MRKLENNQDKLKPCAWCGSDNCWMHEVWNRHTDHAQGYYVECYDCGAAKGAMIYSDGTWDGFYESEADAIEDWNTRAEHTCHKVIPNEMEGYVFCSECGAEIGEYGYPNYCHNCGDKVVD